MATISQAQPIASVEAASRRSARLRRASSTTLVTLLGLAVMLIFLLPIGYMITTAFKDDTQLSAQNAPLYPAKIATYAYQGKDLPLYNMPTSAGTVQWALVHPYREDSDFIDPAHPEKGIFNWKGRWRVLDPVYQIQPTFDNFTNAAQNGAWEQIDFPLLFRNTLLIAIISTIGTLISCILVAYGFARFRVPGKNILFIILISTIVLPPQATIIPLYILFTKLGWTGSWLPLLVPAFFANAYDVFLLRQYFMGIPKELDEAAMLDGANPLQTLIRVIIPQAVPAITAVTLFHFFFTWNDYFAPLVYLVGHENLFPISVGIAKFVGSFSQFPGRAMATAVMTVLLPALLFFFAQRQFMQGIVLTGVDK
ncbi:MAG TPA: carbohydrate ABC transporter permease [Chloroflexia bacterium]|nr:carbohydrate ABC transporter permease [Chloroflexia bacterium]